MFEIVNREVVEWANSYKGSQYHAVLCDPPYELGFMGKEWDKSGVAFRVDTWKAIYNLLLPGAFGMAFASARGFHRMAVAIEDAGFILRKEIHKGNQPQPF